MSGESHPDREIGVRHETDAAGIVHVVFDRPDDKVNLLSSDVLHHLSSLLDDLAARADVRGVLFRSAKPRMFLAGADVEEIAGYDDAFKAAEGARAGQAIFQKIADLPAPSACAIAGPCLGGGTEMALACTYRLAADDDAVRIGLPETRIGIVPGFGGTQRLPRLVGLEATLELVLRGRPIDARRALRIGLVDAVVPREYLEREAIARLVRHDGARRGRAGGRSAVDRAAEMAAPVRRLVLDRARKKLAATVRADAYPAPFRALEAIEAAYAFPLPQGLDVEARIVGELIPTPTAKNLIWLFKSESELRRGDAGVRAVPRPVRRAAVVGAGVMGGGIAALLADREIPVRLRDLRGEALLEALRTARGIFDDRVAKGRMAARERDSRMGFLTTTLDTSGMRRADVVIEAVVEDLDVKRAVLAEVEARVGERAVFATNTSSLPIAEIADRSKRPERVVGLHFFNPVHRMPLVEVVSGPRSSPEAVATIRALAIRLGKTPVVVRDSPGFLVNRVLMPYLAEALRLLGEGLAIGAVDAAMDRFGMPTGPIALLDRIGLDTASHVAGVLRAAFGKRMEAPAVAVDGLVAAGRLGVKSGRGFYRYRDGRRTTPDPEAEGLAGAPARRELPPETIQERLVLAMVNEAAVCLEERIALEPAEIDLAMVLGTGFPPFRGGLLRHADAIGVPIVADRLSRLADAHGERFRPAGLLREMVREQRRFYD